MPDGAVTLPTPEQERKAILALIGFAALVLVGAASALLAIAYALGKVAKWVFGI